MSVLREFVWWLLPYHRPAMPRLRVLSREQYDAIRKAGVSGE